MTAAPGAKGRWSPKRIWGSVAFLAVLAAVGWYLDAILLMRIRVIASEAYAGEAATPAIPTDMVEEILRYPPQRLARCLWVPSAQMRTVVCRTLASRPWSGAPDDWVGVLPALFRTFRTGDQYLRATVQHAANTCPQIPAADVEAVFQFVDHELTEADHWWGVCADMLGAVARDHPDQWTRVLETFERSLPATSFSERRATLARLAMMAPDSSAAAAAVRVCGRDAFPPVPPRGMAGVIERQPTLADELLAGPEHQQGVVFVIATDAKSAARRPFSPKLADWLTDERQARIEAKALALVAAPPAAEHDASFGAACGFLSSYPDAAASLFDAARRHRGKRRAAALNGASTAVRHGPSPIPEQILNGWKADLFAWFVDEDRDVQAAVERILFDNTFARTTGPGPWQLRDGRQPDPPLVAACRQLLDRYPGRQDYFCLLVLRNAGPELEARDIDRVAAALERDLQLYQANYERTSFKPQGNLNADYAVLFDRLAKHQDRPSVRRALELRRSLLADEILAPTPPPASRQ